MRDAGLVADTWPGMTTAAAITELARQRDDARADLDRLREEIEMIGGSIEAERDHYRDAVQRAAILTGVKRGPNEDLAAWLMRALGDVSEQPVTPVLERIRRLERSPARRRS